MTTPFEPLVPGPMTDEPLANESMYLSWHDPERGVTGVHRLAHQPNNQGTGRAQVWYAIMTADGRRYRRGAEVRFDPVWRLQGEFRGEGLAFQHRERGATVSYQDDTCRSDVRFSQFHDPVDWAHTDQEPARNHENLMFSGHVEVGGAVEGVVWLDGARLDVRGMGYRDHSWGGQRDMRPFRTTHWANGTTGPGCTFGVLWASLSTGDVVQGGFVVRDGEMTKVSTIDLTVGMDLDSVTLRRGRLAMGLADGAEVHVEYHRPFDGALFQSGDWVTSDSPTRITVDGVDGLGTIEVAHNARGGLEWPRINGLCSDDGLGVRA